MDGVSEVSFGGRELGEDVVDFGEGVRLGKGR